jgi:hypothetical protein
MVYFPTLFSVAQRGPSGGVSRSLLEPLHFHELESGRPELIDHDETESSSYDEDPSEYFLHEPRSFAYEDDIYEDDDDHIAGSIICKCSVGVEDLEDEPENKCLKQEYTITQSSWVDWLTLLVLLPGLLAVQLHMAYSDGFPMSGVVPEFSLLHQLGERAIMTLVICFMLASYLHRCMVQEQQVDKNSAKSTRGLLFLMKVLFPELLADVVLLLVFFNFVNEALITFMLGILQMSVEVVIHQCCYACGRAEGKK